MLLRIGVHWNKIWKWPQTSTIHEWVKKKVEDKTLNSICSHDRRGENFEIGDNMIQIEGIMQMK